MSGPAEPSGCHASKSSTNDGALRADDRRIDFAMPVMIGGSSDCSTAAVWTRPKPVHRDKRKPGDIVHLAALT